MIVGLLVFCAGCLLIVFMPRLLLDLRKAAMAEHRHRSESIQLADMPLPPAPQAAELRNGSEAALDTSGHSDQHG